MALGQLSPGSLSTALTHAGPAEGPSGSSASEDFLCLHTVSFAGFPGEANPTGSANVTDKRR